MLRHPKLDLAHQMWPHQCQLQGNNCFPWTLGYILANAVGYSCPSSPQLLPQIRLALYQDPQPLLKVKLHPHQSAPSLYCCEKLGLARGQVFSFVNVELHERPVNPLLHLFRVLSYLYQHLPCFVVNCKHLSQWKETNMVLVVDSSIDVSCCLFSPY